MPKDCASKLKSEETWKLDYTCVYMYLRRYIEESSLRVLQAEDGKGRRMQLFTGATKHVAAVVVHRNYISEIKDLVLGLS